MYTPNCQRMSGVKLIFNVYLVRKLIFGLSQFSTKAEFPVIVKSLLNINLRKTSNFETISLCYKELHLLEYLLQRVVFIT